MLPLKYDDVQAALRAAHALIKDPSNWTQHMNARNIRYEQVAPKHPHACKFCAEGAVIAVTGDNYSLQITALQRLNSVAHALFKSNTVAVNDHKDFKRREAHARVMRIYEGAIL